MRYTVHGPFELPRHLRSRLIPRSPEALRPFWDEVVEVSEQGLPDACGCYVFAVRAGRGVKPWYVGQTNRQSFRIECLTEHKRGTYNDVLGQRRGAPLLYLFARRTATGRRFCKPSTRGYRDVDFLENTLIQIALRRNRRLCNSRNTKMIRKMVVPGIMNPARGNPGEPVTALKEVLGL